MKLFRVCGNLFGVLLLLLICANASAVTYTLTVNTNGSGTVSRNPTNSVYPAGVVVTLTAIPSSGWMFTSWSGDASGGANPINVTMDTNKTVTANFALIPTYTLTVLVSGQGSVNPSGGTYQSNTVVSLTPTPANGWLFNAWGGDASGNAVPLDITMNTNKTVTAVFAQPPVIVSQPQSVTNGIGDNVTFTVNANGTAPLTYAWWFISSKIPGATNPSLTLTNVQPSAAGDYFVTVNNAYGSATSQVATLSLTNACSGTNVLSTCDEQHLRQAIAQGGTVRVCCNGTITLTNTIEITNNVALDASDHGVTVSGGNAVRLFSVSTNITFGLTNLMLANGWVKGTNAGGRGTDASGGAIHCQGGAVYLVGCVLSNNAVQGGDGSAPGTGFSGGAGRGGAVYNQGGDIFFDSTIAVSNSVIGGTTTPEVGSLTNGDGMGGALSSEGGKVTIANSVFWGNTAQGRMGNSPNPGAAQGGAIATKDTLVEILASKFYGNLAVGQSAPIPSSGNNRPASAFGGAVFVQSGTATVTRCEFNINSALGGNAYRHSGTGEALGGGIFNLGVLYLSDTSVSTNQAVGGGASSANASGKGGGLYNGGNAYVNGTTFDHNLARGGTAGSFGSPGVMYPGADGNGGAVFNTGIMSGTNCTLTLNQVVAGGTGNPGFLAGGTAYGGGLQNVGGSLSLVNVTIASNSVVQGYWSPPCLGANIANTNGVFSLFNSLVAFGTGSSNAWGTITDGGFNISSDGSCNFSSGASFNFTDPKVGPLANYGGPTLTMALQSNSPAIDFGAATGAPATDQRGAIRPFGAGVDMGAFEAGPTTPPLSARHNGGMIELAFNAETGVSYDLLRSTNLFSWELQESIGPAPTNGPVSRLVLATGITRFFKVTLH